MLFINIFPTDLVLNCQDYIALVFSQLYAVATFRVTFNTHLLYYGLNQNLSNTCLFSVQLSTN